ncbi:MAG: ArsR family transcriptional regulator [Clostridiaceae bacterium]|nr:ArsR family transcriptional regulator [Clostridiaceae bacterium]
MDRDYGRELDELRGELSDMKNVLKELSRGLKKENEERGFHERGGRRTEEKRYAEDEMPQRNGHGPGEHHAQRGEAEFCGHGPESGCGRPFSEHCGRRKMAGHIQKMGNMHPDPHIRAILDHLEDQAGRESMTGAITYLGVYSSGGRQSTWVRNGVNTDDLLRLIEDHTAERILACIGNNDRLNLLLALLRRPMTVAQLVEECGYNSTGQVYHHLKPLIAANLVAEDDHGNGKGRYIVVSRRVQGIIMLLAGISDMLDPSYTESDWPAAEDAEAEEAYGGEEYEDAGDPDNE